MLGEMPTEMPCVLVEMPDEPDCSFVAAWLTAAVKANAYWAQAWDDPEFANRAELLNVGDACPDLAYSALEIFRKLERGRGVAVLALCASSNIELSSDEEEDLDVYCSAFSLLLRLGFFVAGDRGFYRMVMPGEITPSAVKQAALDLVSIAEKEDEGIWALQPERLMDTFPKTAAETQRSIMMAMRRFRIIIA